MTTQEICEQIDDYLTHTVDYSLFKDPSKDDSLSLVGYVDFIVTNDPCKENDKGKCFPIASKEQAIEVIVCCKDSFPLTDDTNTIREKVEAQIQEHGVTLDELLYLQVRLQ